MSKEEGSMKQASQDNTSFLEKTLLSAFEKLARNSDEQDKQEVEQLAQEVINSLKYANATMFGDCPDRLGKLDIFSIFLDKKVDLNFVGIILLYCSLNPNLHGLITGSIANWSVKLSLLQPGLSEYVAGFYTVMSHLEQIENFDIIKLEYFGINISDVLVSQWVPLWVDYSRDNDTLNYLKSNVTKMITNEPFLDFYIATNIHGTGFVKKLLDWKSSDPQLGLCIDKILKRICQHSSKFPESVQTPLYVNYLVCDIPGGLENNCLSLSFNLQVLMELIDHPELNYLEESKLLLLLNMSFAKIRNSYVNILHDNLSEIGSTQSLPALINISQFLLSKFLIDTNSVPQLHDLSTLSGSNHGRNDEKDEAEKHLAKIQIPQWYEKALLPTIPPISKSLFIFDKLTDKTTNDYAKNYALICETLNLALLTNIEIIKQYDSLSIDHFKASESNEIANFPKHKVLQEYIELFFIPIMTVLLLCEDLWDAKLTLLTERVSRTYSKLLLINSIRICEELVKSHGNVVIYHLIKFISNTSIDDLKIQKISINLLHHLFFHNDSEHNFVKQLCLNNELTLNILMDYINVWNDGSEIYTKFYTEIFGIKQPEVEMVEFNLYDICDYDQDESYEEPVKEKELQKLYNFKESSPSLTKPTPNFQVASLPITSSTTGKYDAYSASSFVPSSRPIELTNSNDSTTSKQYHKMSRTTHENHSNTDSSYYNKFAQPDTNDMNKLISADYQSIPSPFFSQPSLKQQNQMGILATPPSTNSTVTAYPSTWSGPSGRTPSYDTNKLVNVGKSYILGGHNRVRNNSRAQSIHIDQFQNIE